MNFNFAIAVFAALVAIVIFAKWFALKDAISMYPRRKKQPVDQKPPDEK